MIEKGCNKGEESALLHPFVFIPVTSKLTKMYEYGKLLI